mgnify:CR=1 FL=1|jgi:hypothetical protein
MDKTFTSKELAAIARDEKILLDQLKTSEVEVKRPSQKSVDNILNFSKAFSRRSSRLIGRIETIIN